MRKFKFGTWYDTVPDNDDAEEMYCYELDQAYVSIWDEFKKSKKRDRCQFDLIKSLDIIQVWNSFITFGNANAEAVGDFEDKMVRNVARLDSLTALQGHKAYCGFKTLEDLLGLKIGTKTREKFYNWTNDENGQYTLSDYGLTPLCELIIPLLTTESPERKLKTIDEMLHITHYRGDLAAFFVEGGRDTLNKLSGQDEE